MILATISYYVIIQPIIYEKTKKVETKKKYLEEKYLEEKYLEVI